MQVPKFGKGQRIRSFYKGRQVEEHLGVSSFDPDAAVIQKHRTYQLDDTLSETFSAAHRHFRERMMLYFHLVGMASFLNVPDEFYKVWLVPKADAVAHNAYTGDGRSYIALEVDDLARLEVRPMAQVLCHEASHLWSFNLTFGWQEAGDLLEIEGNVFRIGICVKEKVVYSVNNITEKDWFRFIQILNSSTLNR